MKPRDAKKDLLAQMDKLKTPSGYYNAGIPNYEHLFGRDSCISALQMLHLDKSPARATLETLTRYAGRRQVLWLEEYPGKILHEHYPGGWPQQWHDLASEGDRLRQLGALLLWRFPYYGSVDAGAWYLILLHHYLESYPDADLASELLPTAIGIAGWLDKHATHTHTKLVGFRRHYLFGLKNQSWKDNLKNAIKPPIAMVEVQGYYFYALKLLAEMVAKYAPDAAQVHQLAARADEIREEFSRYFVGKENGLPMAIDGSGKPFYMVVSNPGQLLFTGILDGKTQSAVVSRLMQPDMLTPFGIRTQLSLEPSFNASSYQNGSVWPFDNWVIHQGLKKSGFVKEAAVIKEALLHAYEAIGEFPEAYGVDETGHILTIRSACRIQAWSAGALINLLDDAPLL